MKIFCEYCGVQIDVNKDSKCPNCGASFEHNVSYKKIREHKKKHEELIAKREALAKEESNKAKELVKKQAESYGVNNTLDPTAKKVEEPVVSTSPVVPTVENQNAATTVNTNSDVIVPEVQQDLKPVEDVVIYSFNFEKEIKLQNNK